MKILIVYGSVEEWCDVAWRLLRWEDRKVYPGGDDMVCKWPNMGGIFTVFLRGEKNVGLMAISQPKNPPNFPVGEQLCLLLFFFFFDGQRTPTGIQQDSCPCSQ